MLASRGAGSCSMAFTVEGLFQTAWRITYGLKTYSESEMRSPHNPLGPGGRTFHGGPGGPLEQYFCPVPERPRGGEVCNALPCLRHPPTPLLTYIFVCFVLFLLTITYFQVMHQVSELYSCCFLLINFYMH